MRRTLERLVTLWALLGGAGLLAIVAVTATNVGAYLLDALARPFGNSVPVLSGYEDFVRLTISAAAPMLLPYCQLKHGHIAVDLLVDRLPRGIRRTSDLVGLAGMAALALFLLYWMVIGMVETGADGAVSRVLGWPEWPFYLPGLGSLALWAVVAIADARALVARA